MPEYCNLCPSRLERDIYLRRALDNVKNKRTKNHTWKDKEYKKLFRDIVDESRSLQCSGFTTYLGRAKVIKLIHDEKIFIKELRQVNLEYALREATKKNSEQALLILIKENSKHCVRLDVRYESELNIFDGQLEKTLEFKDLNSDSVKEVQIVTVDENLKCWDKHCGKRLCSKEHNKVESLSFPDVTCLRR